MRSIGGCCCCHAIMGCAVSAEGAAKTDDEPAPPGVATLEPAPKTLLAVQSLHRLTADIGESLSVVKADVSQLRMDLREDCADLNQSLRELRASLEILSYRDRHS